jgi:hypothetical protein
MCCVFLEDEEKVFEEGRGAWVREFGKERKRDRNRERRSERRRIDGGQCGREWKKP